MDLIAFARPLWLLLIPLVWFWRPRPPAALADTLATLVDTPLHPHVIARSRQPTSATRTRLAASLLLLALAGPQVPLPQSPPHVGPSLARVLVADLSPMVTADPARIARLQYRLAQLLDATPSAALTGIVIYAGDAFAIAPLTHDVETLRRFLPELEADVLPKAVADGDDPARALLQAQRLLAPVPTAVPRQLIWLTPDPARSIPREPETLIVPVNLDATTLSALDVRKDEGSPGSVRSPSAMTDYGPPLIWAAALLWVLPWPARPGRHQLVAVAAGLISGMPTPTTAADRDADPRWQAVAAYRAGNYTDAVTLLQGQADATSHYNRGNALARLGDYRGAIAAYEAALAQRPDDADARHNADLLRRLLPPPGAPSPAPSSNAPARFQEADAIAEQWLQSVPDTPGRLLQRKLAADHARRLHGGAR